MQNHNHGICFQRSGLAAGHRSTLQAKKQKHLASYLLIQSDPLQSMKEAAQALRTNFLYF